MVLGEVVVDVVAEPRVHDALLVQRHRQPHRHPAEELGAGGARVDDPARPRTRRAAARPGPRRWRRRPAPRRTARRTRSARTSSRDFRNVASCQPSPRCRRRPTRSSRHASTTAVPHEAVPDEPPATLARGSALSPISTRTRSTRHAELVGGDLGRAPCARRCRCRRRRSGPGSSRPPRRARVAGARHLVGGIGRGGDAGAVQPAPVAPDARAPGPASAQPKRSAPSRRQATRSRELNGWPVSGCDVRVVADPQLDRVDARRDARARPSPTRARTSRGTRRARAARTGVGTSSAATRCAGAPVRRRVHPARADRGLLGELLQRRGLHRRPRARSPSARPSASAPRRSRWIVGVR